MKKYCIFLIIFFLGCAATQTIPPEGKVIQEIIISSTFDEVWSKLIEIITDLNMPIESVEKVSGILTTSFVSTTIERMAKISYHPEVKNYALFSNCRYKLNIFVKDLGNNKVKIKIKPHYELSGQLMDRPWEIVAHSNGVLEKEIFDKMTLGE
ncbi:MAG: hypothetical protein ISS28_08420 [Candidatus Cloacimonetes bacterium]|nr:hypothetical protein [Candidatus Cloacimonadota bacterium]MBL7087096.1 hypothetical protein [Candidatus Cloacimonadota bacterium]